MNAKDNIPPSLYIPSTSDDSGGKWTDIVAAGTTNLATANGSFGDVTGNTTITALGTANAGIVRKVRFTGTPLLTYHATSLILPGARNIQVEAGDRAEFISLGSGNWLCFAFLKANGMVLGDVIFVTHSATESATVVTMRGHTHVVTGAYTVSLPTAALGYSASFYASTAAAFSIDVVTGTDIIILNGNALTAGYKATSDGTINAECKVECRIAGKYSITGLQGLFFDGGA